MSGRKKKELDTNALVRDLERRLTLGIAVPLEESGLSSQVNLMKIITAKLNPDVLRDPNSFFSFLTGLPLQEKQRKSINLFIVLFEKNAEQLMKDIAELYKINLDQRGKIFVEMMKFFMKECNRILETSEKIISEKPSLSTISMAQFSELLSNVFKIMAPRVVTPEDGSGATLTITAAVDMQSIIQNEHENSFEVVMNVVSNANIQLRDNGLNFASPLEEAHHHTHEYRFKLSKESDQRLMMGLGEADYGKIGRLAELMERFKLINHVVHAFGSAVAEPSQETNEIQLKNKEEKPVEFHAADPKKQVVHEGHHFSHEEHAEFHDLAHHVHGMLAAAEDLTLQLRNVVQAEVVHSTELTSAFNVLSGLKSQRASRSRPASNALSIGSAITVLPGLPAPEGDVPPAQI